MNNIHVTVVYLLVSYILVKQMNTMFIILTVHIAYFTYFKPMFKLSIDFVTWIIPVYAFKSAFYSFVLDTITCSARTLLFLNIYFNWIKRLNLAVHGQIQISSGRYTQAKKTHTNTLTLFKTWFMNNWIKYQKTVPVEIWKWYDLRM